MEAKSTEQRSGYIYAFLCAICSAAMITLIKWVGEGVPTLTLLFLSQGVAGIVLSVILFTGGRERRLLRVKWSAWAQLAGVACLYFFAYWTIFAAIKLLDPTVASFLGRTEVLVTILFAVTFLGERFNLMEGTGALLVFAGVVTIRYVGGVEISRGFILCLVAAFLWGLTEGLAKVVVRSVTPLVFTWGRAVMLLPAFYLTAAFSQEGIMLPKGAALWTGIVALSVIGPVMGRYLYMKSLTLIPVSKTALINQLQPVWVAVLAGILLKTLPSPREWIGGGLIIMGCVLLVRKRGESYTQDNAA